MTITIWQGLLALFVALIIAGVIDVVRFSRARQEFTRAILLEALRRDGMRGLREVPPLAVASEIPAPNSAPTSNQEDLPCQTSS